MPSTKLILGVVFSGLLAFGQFETSEVLGTVRDASEKPVAEIHGAVSSCRTSEAKLILADEPPERRIIGAAIMLAPSLVLARPVY